MACPCSPFSARKRHFLPRRCNTHQSWVELAVPGRVSGHAGSVQSVPHVQTLLAEEARPSVRRIHRVPRRQRRVQPRASCLLPLFHLIMARASSGAHLAGRVGCGATTLSRTVSCHGRAGGPSITGETLMEAPGCARFVVGPLRSRASAPPPCSRPPVLLGSPAPNARQRAGSRPGRGGQGSAAALGVPWALGWHPPIASIHIRRPVTPVPPNGLFPAPPSLHSPFSRPQPRPALTDRPTPTPTSPHAPPSKRPHARGQLHRPPVTPI